jgi:CRP/FNR family cyclic AMP-dependent transcriptional regulator
MVALRGPNGGCPPQTARPGCGTLGAVASLPIDSAATTRRPVPAADPHERSIFAVADRHDGLARPVKVFAHQPGLLADLPPGAARVVRDRAVADSQVLPTGPWTPPSHEELGPGAIGLLVLDGLLSRTIQFAALESPELVGAGDLLRPWDDERETSLEFSTEWRVLERATVALLDSRFARRMCRVPGLTSGLIERTVERSRWLSFQLAIAHVRRAEPRVLMLLWHLADRWGHVTPSGIVVPIRLTHATIARLICMRRPTVSATLVRLARTGEIGRNDDGTWLLTGSPPDLATVNRGRDERLAAA